MKKDFCTMKKHANQRIADFRMLPALCLSALSVWTPCVLGQQAPTQAMQSAEGKRLAEIKRKIDAGLFRGMAAPQALPMLLPAVQTISRETSGLDIQGLVLETIGRLGVEGKGAIPRVLEIAFDEKNEKNNEQSAENLRITAIKTLGRIGSKSPEVVSRLIRILEMDNPNISPHAVDALLRMKDQALPAMAALDATLDSKWDSFAFQSFSALGQLSAVKKSQTLEQALEVLRRLSETVPTERPTGEVAAAFQAVAAGEQKGAVARPLLLQLLQTRPQAYVKNIALETLNKTGPGGGEQVAKILIEVAKTPAINYYWTQSVFMKIDPSDVSAVAPLVETLNDKDRSLQDLATRVLSLYGTAAAPAIPVLLTKLRSTAPVHYWPGSTANQLAVLIRAEAGEQGTQVVLELLAPDSQLFQACEPRFREALRGMLLQALACFGGPKDPAAKALALRHVTEALQSNQANLFISAARVVEVMGPDAASTVPLLLAALRPGFTPRTITDHNTPFFRTSYSGHVYRFSAIRALARIGKPAAEALPLIREFAQNEPREKFYSSNQNKLNNEHIEALTAVAVQSLEGKPSQNEPTKPSASETRWLSFLFRYEWLFSMPLPL